MESSVSVRPSFQYSFALIDAEGRLVDWDEGFEREWFGFQRGLKRGALYHDILRDTIKNPKVRKLMTEGLGVENVDGLVESLMAGFGSARSREYTLEGSIIQVDELPTRSGGVQRVARNITEERRAQEALAVAQQYRQITTDADKGGVYMEIWRSPDGKFSMPPISDEMARLMNLPAQMIGADPWIIVSRMTSSTEEIARMRATLESAAQMSEPFTYEFFIKDDEGLLRWMRQSLIPRHEADGNIIFSGVMRDVTREKEAEDNVELLRSVVVRSFDSVMILETEAGAQKTKVLYVNPKFEQLYGQPASEIVGASIDKLSFLIGDMEEALSLYMAVASGEREAAEIELTNAEGHKFWVEMRADVIQTLSDGRYRWVMISRDVSERRRALNDAFRAKDAAENANRAKGEFLANMSHELRTPLNAIIGFSELIHTGVKRTGWEEDYLEYIEDIVSSGRHLLDLINSVLDLSKIEAGLLRLDLDRVALDDLIRSSVTVMSGLAHEADIKLTVDGEIGATDFVGDELKLKQVLLNIISNAIKFTPRGGEVTINARTNTETVVIAISDTGCGINAQDLDRIGRPFVQVDSSLGRKHAGTGLGLSIAKQLCELHGGSLELSSVVGQGTIVTIALPREPQAH